MEIAVVVLVLLAVAAYVLYRRRNREVRDRAPGRVVIASNLAASRRHR